MYGSPPCTPRSELNSSRFPPESYETPPRRRNPNRTPSTSPRYWEKSPLSDKCPIDDIEAISQQTWSELIRQAQEKHIPYYTLGVTEWYTEQNGISKKRFSFYDGQSLKNFIDEHPCADDPATRMRIVKTHYVAVQCLRLGETPGTLISIEPKDCTFSYFLDPEDTDSFDLKMDASNPHLNEDLEDTTALALMQHELSRLFQKSKSSSSTPSPTIPHSSLVTTTHSPKASAAPKPSTIDSSSLSYRPTFDIPPFPSSLSGYTFPSSASYQKQTSEEQKPPLPKENVSHSSEQTLSTNRFGPCISPVSVLPPSSDEGIDAADTTSVEDLWLMCAAREGNSEALLKCGKRFCFGFAQKNSDRKFSFEAFETTIDYLQKAAYCPHKPQGDAAYLLHLIFSQLFYIVPSQEKLLTDACHTSLLKSKKLGFESLDKDYIQQLDKIAFIPIYSLKQYLRNVPKKSYDDEMQELHNLLDRSFKTLNKKYS